MKVTDKGKGTRTIVKASKSGSGTGYGYRICSGSVPSDNKRTAAKYSRFGTPPNHQVPVPVPTRQQELWVRVLVSVPVQLIIIFGQQQTNEVGSIGLLKARDFQHVSDTVLGAFCGGARCCLELGTAGSFQEAQDKELANSPRVWHKEKTLRGWIHLLSYPV